MSDRILAAITKCAPQRWHWILEHAGFRRYFVNTGWMFAGQIFSLLVSFFIGAWVARYLGPRDYGIISYVVAFVGLFSFIAPLGIDSILNRELVKFPERRDVLLGTALRLKMIGGGLAFVAAILAAFLIRTAPAIRLLIILYSFIFIFQAINVIYIFFQAQVAAKNNIQAQLVATVISSLLKILVIVSSLGMIWLIIIYVLDTFWLGWGLIAAYKRNGLSIGAWHFDALLAKNLWQNAWPLILAGAAAFTYIRIDQVMIGWILGETAVGIYAAAVRIVEGLYFIPNIISASLFPALVNAKKTDARLYRRRLKFFYIFILVCAVILALPIFIFSGPIIQFLFGEAYASAVPILRIYAWSCVGLFLGLALNQYLITENKIRTVFITNFLTVFINIGLNLILIPRLFLPGAALATLISYLAIPFVVTFFQRFENVAQPD
ncbi:MAG: flippase [Patescibacteria group bacterium]